MKAVKCLLLLILVSAGCEKITFDQSQSLITFHNELGIDAIVDIENYATCLTLFADNSDYSFPQTDCQGNNALGQKYRVYRLNDPHPEHILDSGIVHINNTIHWKH